MAYLRTCRFDVEVALNCYKKFYKARLCKPEKIFPVGKGLKDYMKYYEKPITAFLPQRNPLDGSLILVYSFRNFDSNSDDIVEIFNAVFSILMEVVVDPSIQVHGVRFIIDYTGVEYSVIVSAIGKMYYNKVTLRDGINSKFTSFRELSVFIHHYHHNPFNDREIFEN